MAAVDVIQLSDLHVTLGGDLHGQDPRANLERILGDVERRRVAPAAVVATGDLADDGEAAAYAWLRERLGALGVPVYCLAGNHDREPAFTEHLPGGVVQVRDAVDLGEWRFLFVDTNALGRRVGDDGEVVDVDDRRHSARAGDVLPADADRLRAELATSGDRPVMVWLHHPAIAHPRFVGLEDRDYTRWLTGLVSAAGNVRGVSAGHVHSPYERTVGGVRHFTCPSGWLALDLDAGTLTPPGYRAFRFHPDGRIDATVHHVDDGIGPAREPFPAWVPKVLAEGG